MPFCSTHGIRVHSNSFVYWNGTASQKHAKLRNFSIRRELAAEIALDPKGKAETHRLGYETSEDALSWNVFVGLAAQRKLRDAVKFLTGKTVDSEPKLYMWGKQIDVAGRERGYYQPLNDVRDRLECDIRRFKTEPDIMLVLEGQLIVLIEAKFCSGNPVAHEKPIKVGEKPVDWTGLLQRYLDPASPKTIQVINRECIGQTFHSQLFRNVIFGSEMATDCDWHIVNLVSDTQWQLGKDSRDYSFRSPEEYVHCYLQPAVQNCFSFRSWEGLHRALIRDDPDLTSLDSYMREKSAHYLRAFQLD